MNNLQTNKEFVNREPIYLCLIKSHCDAPDFEYEVTAKNIDEAVTKFQSIINQGTEESWSIEEIKPYVMKIGAEV